MINTKSHQGLALGAKRVKDTPILSLLKEPSREDALYVKALGIILDFSRQKMSLQDFNNLIGLAEELNLESKIQEMFQGKTINQTEKRPVLHVALRTPASHVINVSGVNVVPLVHEVLNKINAFSNAVRSGAWTGYTGKPICDIICVGIGGSYLGSEFIFEALKTHHEAKENSKGRRLHFLANIDPVDVERATTDFNPETTLVIIISKTFTTAETMLNAKTLKKWFVDKFGDPSSVAKHMVAVSTNIKATTDFGILPENVFGFWDWVGGRFSVCSAVGCLPLALHYGPSIVRQFLDGCHAMDNHFKTATLKKNLPVLMGLISLWNSTYLNYGSVAVLPYSQALLRFSAHIQQLTMESNGKRVNLHGEALPFDAGEIFFGEPGTNGQHSFYQLLHQGRVIPAEFIGFIKSQNPIHIENEPVSNHDELMSNFFAQADALVLGKSSEQCRADGVPENLIPHKVFPGDRPSSILLFPECSPYTLGLILSLYEHRTAVQGFLWNINSFDQWGVELGKVLAKNVRTYLFNKRKNKDVTDIEKSFLPSTKKLLEEYLQQS